MASVPNISPERRLKFIEFLLLFVEKITLKMTVKEQRPSVSKDLHT